MWCLNSKQFYLKDGDTIIQLSLKVPQDASWLCINYANVLKAQSRQEIFITEKKDDLENAVRKFKLSMFNLKFKLLWF